MTVKQLAERLGVSVKELSFEFCEPCRKCEKTGGTAKSCESCTPKLTVETQE